MRGTIWGDLNTASSQNKPRKRWIAIVLALIAPGLGHVYAGRLRPGLILALTISFAGPALLAVGLFLSLPILTVLVVTVFVLICVVIAQMIWAGRLATRGSKTYSLQWFNRVPFYLGYYFCLAILPVGHVTRALAESWSVSSESMEPDLKLGDSVFVRKWRYTPQRGDLVVFRPPDKSIAHLKRVIGVGGDRVAVRDGFVYLGGHPLPRGKLRDSSGLSTDTSKATTNAANAPLAGTPPTDVYWEELDGMRYRILHDSTAASADVEEQEVPADHLFLLGDHRSQSFDSRQFGSVPLTDVDGVVESVFFSWTEDGFRWDRVGLDLRRSSVHQRAHERH